MYGKRQLGIQIPHDHRYQSIQRLLYPQQRSVLLLFEIHTYLGSYLETEKGGIASAQLILVRI